MRDLRRAGRREGFWAISIALWHQSLSRAKDLRSFCFRITSERYSLLSREPSSYDLRTTASVCTIA
jgi:hypothetical protein